MAPAEARHSARARAGRPPMSGGNTYRVTAKAARMPAAEVTAISRTPGNDVQAMAANPAAVVTPPRRIPVQMRRDHRLGRVVGGEQAVGQQQERVVDGHPDQRRANGQRHRVHRPEQQESDGHAR